MTLEPSPVSPRSTPPHARGAETAVKTQKAQKVPDPVGFPSKTVTFISALCFFLLLLLLLSSFSRV